MVAAADGLATTRELRVAGCSEYALTAAVRTGRLHRIRKGWYTTLDAAAPRVVAVRSGGVLTVPFFVFDGQYGVSGAQESATFANVLEQVRDAKEPAA